MQEFEDTRTPLNLHNEENLQNEEINQTFDSQWDWPQRQFEEAGTTLKSTGLRKLPSTQELTDFVGKSPVILDGTDSINEQ